MAINQVTFPTPTTPTLPTDYDRQNELIERAVRGYNAVSLTNWDGTTTAPQIAAGSVFEANGVVYDITTNTSITNAASSGTCYLIAAETSAVVTSFEWTNTAPTWSDSLNGWYVSGERATGHVCEWDGATAYSEKERIENTADGLKLRYRAVGDFYINGAARTRATINNSSATPVTQVLPRGVIDYQVQANATGCSVLLQIKDSLGSWYTLDSLDPSASGTTYKDGGQIISDGVNYRASVAGNGAATATFIYYYTA